MYRNNTFSLDGIGIHGTYQIADIPTIPEKNLSYILPKQDILYTWKDEKRAILKKQKKVDHGSYGNLYLCLRDNQKKVLCKEPRISDMKLTQEGILQHLAHTVLEQFHISWGIPKVYDVFRMGNSSMFSMDYVEGLNMEEWFQKSLTPDKDFFLFLAQISIILGLLETYLALDHRDLKADNLLIKEEHCSIQVNLGGKLWSLTSPFQVVVLDFGFACLGSEPLRGKPLVNLGDGVLPPMDPCPKEGRDIFQLLISLLGISVYRSKLSARVLSIIDNWLAVGKKSYGEMARRWSAENWSYLVASQRHFAIPTCCPLYILQQSLPELSDHLHIQ